MLPKKIQKHKKRKKQLPFSSAFFITRKQYFKKEISQTYHSILKEKKKTKNGIRTGKSCLPEWACVCNKCVDFNYLLNFTSYY